MPESMREYVRQTRLEEAASSPDSWGVGASISSIESIRYVDHDWSISRATAADPQSG